ncbi:HAD-IA family hydrolase [Legionella impletisoli]|uniref:Phosphoglycolate phosphatase n=1 Tax=Legionella impletisoli TaxID=343510 RepID=A0A917JP44_9GAMM|nr:HAD-IA family hydrolase [Legionella impletisoli]GGI76327.1 phosphoglycolate phosphatase [Legionella impletisoli]
MDLLFDFDGTLADSGDIVFKALCASARNQLTLDELRNLPSDQVIPSLGISLLKLPFLILEIRSEIRRNINSLPLAPDMKETLKTLNKEGHRLHIASSNSTKNINEFLKNHEIHHFFSSISSLFTIFGKAKGLRKIIADYKINLNNALYIGDETRDIEAANQVNIKSCAICWGYNSECILQTYNPDFLIKSPIHLLRTIDELNS